ncbi:MAG TPA: putative LPS assembly protein LptD [Longimicrobiales bacterium]|nr:putative LPS assembly protein LptD [Longimicrobiales bacterium]
MRTHGPLRRVVLVVVCHALLAPVPALAQQPTPRQPPTPRPAPQQPATQRPDTAGARARPQTPRDRALSRLRALPQQPLVVRPDTFRQDTLGADTLANRARAGVAGRTGGARPQSAQASDSTQAQLMTLPGYTAVQYQGQGARYSVERGELELTGKANVDREGQSLATDSLLVYNGNTGVVCGYGTPKLSGEGNAPVESDSLCYNTKTRVGVATGASTQFQQNGTWYVRGNKNRVFMVGNDRIYGERTQFTSCDLPQPHYTFTAAKLKMINGGVMVARDVTLNFEDVPVFWLPFMVQSMKHGRRSGILTPQFGLNDVVRNSVGYQRRISNLGFYWAIDDYMGAQVAADWWAGNWLGLEGTFDYRWIRQFLNGNMTVRRFWRDNGSKDLTITGSSSWQPDERTSMNLQANYATSSQFIQQNSFDPNELKRDITSNATINRRFDWGTTSLGLQRRQSITEDRVDMTLPNLAISLSPVTISRDLGINWSGSGNFRSQRTDFTGAPAPGQRATRNLGAQMSSNLDLGQLRWSQNVQWTRAIQGALPAFDSAAVPGLTAPVAALPQAQRDQLTWNTSLGYTINLMAGTTLTPHVAMSGQALADSLTSGMVSAPTRINTGVSLGTTIYGFWPGVGPVTRIRHKISPSLSWTYSPALKPTALQDSVFGASQLKAQNVLTLSFNQTFEAKLAGSDTAAADTAAADSLAQAAAQGGAPRRLPQAKKVQLLSINTSALAYDFVQAREPGGHGFNLQQFNTSLRSGLLPGFDFSMTHDLFKEEQVGTGTGTTQKRQFAPFLSNMRASFSIDNKFWLFRVLGLSGTQPVAAASDTAQADTSSMAGMPGGAPGGGSVMGGGGGPPPLGGGRPAAAASGGGIGAWQAQLSYTMARVRPDPTRPFATQSGDNRLLQGSVSFKPGKNWSLRWQTSYSFTSGQFSDQMITLTRDLHRWRANFNFVKTQTGNFAFVFRVDLIDNPDLKLDYNQHSRGGGRAAGGQY